jgi:Uma2 family endonuclease
MAPRIEPLLTVADLDACPDDNNRYELIGGELYVSRAPGIPHQRILQNLQMELALYLEKNPIGITVPGVGATFSDYDAVIPDLAFVRMERWKEVVTGEKFTGALDLVVEITLPGKENRDRDLLVKRQLYAKYGVTEYWIIDTTNRQVLIYHLHGEILEEVSALTAQEEITSAIFPGLHLSVNSIFAVEPHD